MPYFNCIRCGKSKKRIHREDKFCSHKCYSDSRKGQKRKYFRTKEYQWLNHFEENHHSESTKKMLRVFLRKNITINEDGCWIWNKAKTKRGYGIVTTKHMKGKRRMFFVHRLSALVFLKQFDFFNKKVTVCHHCDNPPCVNPSHLFIGAQMDNIIDMAKKKRSSKVKLTPKKVREIRGLSKVGYLIADLAQKYSVSELTIQRVVNRTSWKQVA